MMQQNTTHNNSSSPSSTSLSTPLYVPTTCKQEAAMVATNPYQYPVFAQPSLVQPSSSFCMPPSQPVSGPSIPTISFVNGEPWLPSSSDAALVSTISSTIGSMQLSSPNISTTPNSQRPHALEMDKNEDNEFNEEMGDEVCFLVNNFHVKDSDANFMPYIM